MQNLDRQVVQCACQWLEAGSDVWLCTVLSTFGSSPREPGSMLAVNSSGDNTGSLSGGCIEEDFLSRVRQGEFDRTVQIIQYGQGGRYDSVQLPCGGHLSVLIEKLSGAEAISHLNRLLTVLDGQRSLWRKIDLTSGARTIIDADHQGAKIAPCEGGIKIRIAPVLRFIIAGASTVAQYCAQFAKALNYEVIVCDPRPEVVSQYTFSGCTVVSELPSTFIATPGNCHHASCVVALTHDPRIDDLALMEAVASEAFYIGVMGSERTSRARAERLQRIGRLTDRQLRRIHMPIGLAIGSKTPAEIALAVIADVVRVFRGRARHEL